MTDDFALHERLEADTAFISDLPLTRVLLMRDVRYPWLILVPRRPGAVDLDSLAQDDLRDLFLEARLASLALKRLFTPDRINVGALGNMVTQLHLHVIARFEDDDAWPGPVWGAHPALPYDAATLGERLHQLRAALTH
ncbi:HIT family protein [Limibacillus sp. MBR-115]|jgi:diadenosine tetraphosphate (Ap4A) HIT family hydrolase|uniref:HIT family protein n=1 Tax=Limibacillus sp. MBR-115 TaxID=3156465 RepID=UPI003395E403